VIFIVFLLRKWWGFVYFFLCVADSIVTDLTVLED
jgi:hypothetical protein